MDGERKVPECYDIDLFVDNAVQDGNTERMLWFARIRNYMLQASQFETAHTLKLIINRLNDEGSNNPRVAHRLLHILQMCAVHCSEAFILGLNDKDALQTVLEAQPIQTYDDAVCLKLSTLLQSWHEKNQDLRSNSAFEKIYEALVSGCEQSPLNPVNLHWFPNRNIMNQPLDHFTYDLGKLGRELLQHSKAYLDDLKAFCTDPEHSKLKYAQAEGQDPQRQAHMTLKLVEADQCFWADIMQHADMPAENLEEIIATGENLCQMKSDVEQVIEKLNGNALSRSVDQSSGLQGDHGLDCKTAQPLANSRLSHSDHVNTTSQSDPSAACLEDSTPNNSDDGPSKQYTELLERNRFRLAVQNSGSQIAASAGDSSVVFQTQVSKDQEPLASNQSSNSDNANNTSKRNASAACFGAGPSNICDTEETKEYKEVRDRYRSRLLEQNSGSQIAASAGDSSVVFQTQVSKDQEPLANNRSSNSDSAVHISQHGASAEGRTEEYDKILERYRRPAAGDNKGSEMSASTGERTVLLQNKELVPEPAASGVFDPNNAYQTNTSTASRSAPSHDLMDTEQEPLPPDSTQPKGHQRATRDAHNWMCPICGTGFQTKQEYISHLSSDEHKEAVSRLPPLLTDVAESPCTLSGVTEDAESEKDSQSHCCIL